MRSKWRRIKVYVREAFARVKIFVDIAVNKQPHFLGETIEIGEGKPQEDINVLQIKIQTEEESGG